MDRAAVVRVGVVESGSWEGPGQRGPQSKLLDIDQQEQLLEAVKALACMTEPTLRHVVVERMQRELGSAFSPTRFTNNSHSDIFAIVEACLDNDAVHMLVKLTRMIGGMTTEWSKFNQLVADLYDRGIVLVTEFAEIQEQLKALTRQDLTEVFASPQLGPDTEPSFYDQPTAIAAFQRLELAAGETAGDQRLLVFLELVAHRLPQDRSRLMHRTIDVIAERRNLGQWVTKMCQSIFLAGSASWETPVPDSGDFGKVDIVPSSSATPSDPGDEDSSMRPTIIRPGPGVSGVAPSQPKVLGGVPPRNPNFTGRSDLLNEIRRLLRQRSQASLLPLAGLGGVGKTQLAIEYVHRYQGDYELIWWIPADEKGLITRSFVSLAKRLDLPESQDQERVVEAVLDELRIGRPANWLLVFDNALDPRVVREFVPSGPGHILITSRSQEWASEAASVVNVDVFKEDEAVEFLSRRWPDITRDQALSLADRLGYLPLAMDHAAALHVETGMPVDEYLRNFDAAPVKLLDEAPSDYQPSVAATFRVGFDKLKEASPAAAQLLELCAFLSDQPIDIKLLIRGRTAAVPELLGETLRDDIALRRAIRRIGRFALAQLDSGREFIRVHRLVRVVVMADAPPETRETMRQAAFAILAAANPGQPDYEANWSQQKQIAPHIIPSGIISSDDRDARLAVLDQIRYHYVIGDYDSCQKLGKLVVESWRARMADDAMTLVASRHWADALRSLGDREGAYRLNRETLDRMRANPGLGPDHEHTLATANGFGADLRLQGQFSAARELDLDNSQRCARILGDEDPLTLRARNSLALDERLLGHFDTSIAIQRAVRDGFVNVLGEEYPQTLAANANLARDYYGLGQYRDGLDVLKDKLDTFTKKLGRSHYYVLFARRYNAILMRKSGDAKAALVAAEQNYDDCLQLRQPTHDLTLAAMVTLSNSLRIMGDTEQARSLGQSAFECYQDNFGKRHPFTLACANDYAISLRAAGRAQEAATLDEATFAALTEVLGPEHPHTLCSMAGRASNLALAGRAGEALAVSKDLYEISKRARRYDHPVTLSCTINLALDLETSGDKTGAVLLRDETIRRMRAQLGNDHFEVKAAGNLVRAECDIEIATT